MAQGGPGRIRPRISWRSAIEKARKESYLENICNEIMEMQRTGRYDLMYMKTKELGSKETQEFQNIGTEDFQGNRIVDQRQVLKIWENNVTELYDRTNRPETPEVESEEEVDTDEKGPHILQGEVEKLSRKWGTERLQEKTTREILHEIRKRKANWIVTSYDETAF